MTHDSVDPGRYANVSANGRAPDERGDDGRPLRELLASDDVRTRRDAALGFVDRAEGGLDDDAVDALGARVESDPDADVRQFAVEALGVAGAGTAAVDAGLDDPDPWVRAEAVVACSRVGGERVREQLRSKLDDEHGWVRRNALIALAKHDALDAETLTELVKSDPHPAVREYAVVYLGEYGNDPQECVRLLAAVLARDPNAIVRAKAATSLGSFGTDRAVEALESQGLPDRSDDVRRAAKQALGVARGESNTRDDAAQSVESASNPSRTGAKRGPRRGNRERANDSCRHDRSSSSCGCESSDANAARRG